MSEETQTSDPSDPQSSNSEEIYSANKEPYPTRKREYYRFSSFFSKVLIFSEGNPLASTSRPPDTTRPKRSRRHSFRKTIKPNKTRLFLQKSKSQSALPSHRQHREETSRDLQNNSSGINSQYELRRRNGIEENNMDSGSIFSSPLSSILPQMKEIVSCSLSLTKKMGTYRSLRELVKKLFSHKELDSQHREEWRRDSELTPENDNPMRDSTWNRLMRKSSQSLAKRLSVFSKESKESEKTEPSSSKSNNSQEFPTKTPSTSSSNTDQTSYTDAFYNRDVFSPSGVDLSSYTHQSLVLPTSGLDGMIGGSTTDTSNNDQLLQQSNKSTNDSSDSDTPREAPCTPNQPTFLHCSDDTKRVAPSDTEAFDTPRLNAPITDEISSNKRPRERSFSGPFVDQISDYQSTDEEVEVIYTHITDYPTPLSMPTSALQTPSGLDTVDEVVEENKSETETATVISVTSESTSNLLNDDMFKSDEIEVWYVEDVEKDSEYIYQRFSKSESKDEPLKNAENPVPTFSLRPCKQFPARKTSRTLLACPTPLPSISEESNPEASVLDSSEITEDTCSVYSEIEYYERPVSKTKTDSNSESTSSNGSKIDSHKKSEKSSESESPGYMYGNDLSTQSIDLNDLFEDDSYQSQYENEEISHQVTINVANMMNDGYNPCTKMKRNWCEYDSTPASTDTFYREFFTSFGGHHNLKENMIVGLKDKEKCKASETSISLENPEKSQISQLSNESLNPKILSNFSSNSVEPGRTWPSPATDTSKNIEYIQEAQNHSPSDTSLKSKTSERYPEKATLNTNMEAPVSEESDARSSLINAYLAIGRDHTQSSLPLSDNIKHSNSFNVAKISQNIETTPSLIESCYREIGQTLEFWQSLEALLKQLEAKEPVSQYLTHPRPLSQDADFQVRLRPFRLKSSGSQEISLKNILPDVKIPTKQEEPESSEKALENLPHICPSSISIFMLPYIDKVKSIIRQILELRKMEVNSLGLATSVHLQISKLNQDMKEKSELSGEHGCENCSKDDCESLLALKSRAQQNQSNVELLEICFAEAREKIYGIENAIGVCLNDISDTLKKLSTERDDALKNYLDTSIRESSSLNSTLVGVDKHLCISNSENLFRWFHGMDSDDLEKSLRESISSLHSLLLQIAQLVSKVRVASGAVQDDIKKLLGKGEVTTGSKSADSCSCQSQRSSIGSAGTSSSKSQSTSASKKRRNKKKRAKVKTSQI